MKRERVRQQAEKERLMKLRMDYLIKKKEEE